MESLLVRPLPSGSLQNKMFESHSNIEHTLAGICRLRFSFFANDCRFACVSSLLAGLSWARRELRRTVVLSRLWVSSGTLPLSVGLGPVAQVVRAHP